MPELTNTLTAVELAKLEACPDEQAWDALCDEIKAAHGGGYPADWYTTVIADGGVMARVANRWGKPRAFDIGVVAVEIDR